MMNYYMQGSSETIISSEEESDHDHEDHQDDDDESAKRSYECTFCRRGFTNAQALGGHMNIHRKDRAKAKKLLGTPNNNLSSSSPSKYYTTTHDEESMASSCVPPQISSSSSSSHQTPNCYTIFQPSSSSAPAAYAFQYEFLSTTRYHHHHHHQSLGTNHQDHHLLGPNLSLQIGPSHHHVVNTDQVTRGIHQKDGSDVVDLELRLGHHPCSNY